MANETVPLWTAEQVAERIWLVRAPLNQTIGASITCLYVIRGSKLAVVDTGFSFHPGDSLAPALASLGLRLDEVDYILNTHGHADHLGGNAALKDASGASVHLHQNDLHFAGGPEAHINSSADVMGVLNELGWQDEIANQEILFRQRIGRDVGVDRILEDGDVVDLGTDMRFVVVHTPGHTAGSVTYFLERDGIALTGDAIQGWGGGPGTLPIICDTNAYQASLDRLLELPIQKLLLGHPFLWSGESAPDSPVRIGADVHRTIRDSQAFFPLAHQAAQAALRQGPASLDLLVQRVLADLPEPFHVTVGDNGRYRAYNAMTLRDFLPTGR